MLKIGDFLRSHGRFLKVCPKQLEYNSEICDQTGCGLKTKPIGVESCMAQVC